MVKHIIVWTLKSEYSNEEKEKIKSDIKLSLESLMGKVPGLTDIKVQTQCLASSNADLMLDSTFVSEDAFKGYLVHPDHVAAANDYVRPHVMIKSCVDFEIE
ncbi:MAG: Dabb family protein [Clostridia bacterium]|nr:Dabb family protein [Clostridia bacterium]